MWDFSGYNGYDWVVLLFWNMLYITSALNSISGGVYHLASVQILSFLLQFMGLLTLSRESTYDAINASTCVTPLCNFLFMYLWNEYKEYNRGVYLAFSKKAMSLNYGFDNWLRMNKHWVVVVPAHGNKYYVFDARGKIMMDLKPNFEIWSLEEVEKHLYGIQPMGVTSRRLLRMFLKKKLEGSWTCQQYSYFVINTLVYPTFSSTGYINGRFDFFLGLFVTLILWFVNVFFETKFDLSIPILLFLFYDFFNEYKDDNSHEVKFKIRDIFTTCISFIFFTYFSPDIIKINGYLTIYLVCMELTVNFLVRYITVKPWSEERMKKKKKKKKTDSRNST